jgi:hypothetical protein
MSGERSEQSHRQDVSLRPANSVRLTQKRIDRRRLADDARKDVRAERRAMKRVRHDEGSADTDAGDCGDYGAAAGGDNPKPNCVGTSTTATAAGSNPTSADPPTPHADIPTIVQLLRSADATNDAVARAAWKQLRRVLAQGASAVEAFIRTDQGMRLLLFALFWLILLLL